MTQMIETTEQLLASWRDAQRTLDQFEPDDPDYASAAARLTEARAAYHDRIEAIEVAPPHGEIASLRDEPEMRLA